MNIWNRLSLRVRMLAGFLLICSMLIAMSGLAWWSLEETDAAAMEMKDRLRDVSTAREVNYWALRQYAAQADRIINQDPAAEKAFYEARDRMDEARDRLGAELDTAQEQEWLRGLMKADEAFDQVFTTQVIDECRHQESNVLGQADAATDAGLETARKGIADALVLPLQPGERETLHRLDVAFLMMYQAQADLIINRDEAVVSSFSSSAREAAEALAALRRSGGLPPDVIGRLETVHGNIRTIFQEQVLPEVKRIKEERLRKFDELSDGHLQQLSDLLGRIITSLEEEAREAEQDMDTTRLQAEKTIVVLSIAALLLAILMAVIISSNLANGIRRAVDGLRRGAEEVSSASESVAQGSQELAGGANEQAASLEEVSASIEEMTATIRMTADNGRQADTAGRDTLGAASRGQEAMRRMNSAIERIRQSSDETAGIVKNIDEIAFQTNLLALNAAVEAARAGEAGKGFAVVAEEVRNLAQRSAEAAKNTTQRIDEARTHAGEGVAISRQVGEALDEIERQSSHLKELVSEIAAAAGEQTRGIDQIGKATQQLNSVTQNTASSAEEAASACEELNAQAEELNRIVEELNELVEGRRS